MWCHIRSVQPVKPNCQDQHGRSGKWQHTGATASWVGVCALEGAPDQQGTWTLSALSFARSGRVAVSCQAEWFQGLKRSNFSYYMGSKSLTVLYTQFKGFHEDFRLSLTSTLNMTFQIPPWVRGPFLAPFFMASLCFVPKICLRGEKSVQSCLWSTPPDTLTPLKTVSEWIYNLSSWTLCCRHHGSVDNSAETELACHTDHDGHFQQSGFYKISLFNLHNSVYRLQNH